MTDPKKMAKRAEMERRGCKDCLFFEHRKCIFGMRNCVLPEPGHEGKNCRRGWYGCSACPYGRGRPCVSFCMKQLLEDWRKERFGAGKEVSVYV